MSRLAVLLPAASAGGCSSQHSPARLGDGQTLAKHGSILAGASMPVHLEHAGKAWTRQSLRFRCWRSKITGSHAPLGQDPASPIRLAWGRCVGRCWSWRRTQSIAGLEQGPGGGHA